MGFVDLMLPPPVFAVCSIGGSCGGGFCVLVYLLLVLGRASIWSCGVSIRWEVIRFWIFCCCFLCFLVVFFGLVVCLPFFAVVVLVFLFNPFIEDFCSAIFGSSPLMSQSAFTY